VTLLVGVITLRLSLSSLMLNYVKQGMRPWLVASGATLCFLGVIGFLRATRPGAVHDHEHHDHPPSRAAWLLILPVLTILLVAPDPLGSFAAGRQTAVAAPSTATFKDLPPPRNGAIEITLQDFADRAAYDEAGSLKGKTVRLIGFVTAAGTSADADFVLNRFVISCCAADARISQVEMSGAKAPRVDSWVSVTGTWQPGKDVADVGTAIMSVKSVTPITQPEVPYESL
jgi:uncharacterized repeat protein (TIGR03943 family)